MVTRVAEEITIDGAGRLVIPKPLRDKLHLVPGTRLHITDHEGGLVLTPDRPEPRLIERDGYLIVDLGVEAPPIEAGVMRDERLRDLVEYALRR